MPNSNEPEQQEQQSEQDTTQDDLPDDDVPEIDDERYQQLVEAERRLAEREGRDAPEADDEDEVIPFERYQQLLDAEQRLQELEPQDEAPADDDPAEDTTRPDQITRQEYEELKAAKQELARFKERYGKLDAEHKKLAKRVKAFETDRLTEQQRKDLEREEALKQVTALKEQLRGERGRRALAQAAQKHNIPVELAEELILNAVTYDDEDTPQEVETLVTDLVQRHPYLSKPQPRPSQTNPDSARRNQPKALTAEDIRRMTPDQINERWDEVQTVLATSA